MRGESRNTSTCWKQATWGLAAVLVSWIIIDGGDRRAAEATRPIALRGDTEPWPTESHPLRLASFNIHSGRGRDDRYDLERTASVLDTNLDFVGLNEVRAAWLGPDQAQILGTRLNLASAFLPTERHWWRDHFGNALLTRRPLAGLMRCPLPGTRGKAFRNVVLAYLPYQGRTVKILVTHIDRETDRKHQLEVVLQLFLSLEPPVVLMGDLNSTIDEPLLASLLEQPDVHSALHEGIAGGPVSGTIDWLFHRGMKTISAKLVEVEASDHPVLFAELTLNELIGQRASDESERSSE